MHVDTKGEAEKPGRETRQDSMGEGGGLGQAVSIINEKQYDFRSFLKSFC